MFLLLPLICKCTIAFLPGVQGARGRGKFLPTEGISGSDGCGQRAESVSCM